MDHAQDLVVLRLPAPVEATLDARLALLFIYFFFF